jgi:hypothetical protein
MGYKQRKIIRATDGDFKVFVAFRQNGLELDELVQDFGRNVAMGFEGLYQKFCRGGVV